MAVAQGKARKELSVEAWLDTRASWLRAAAQEMVNTGKVPDEAALEVLADLCLAEATGTLVAPHEPLVPGVIQAVSAGPKLRITRVSKIRGVNAFGARAELALSGDLTVVYGPNGAGKSGYARLMKHICGAKAAETIYGNVFSDEAEPIGATVCCDLTGAKDGAQSIESVEHAWQASEGALRSLASVHVFDSATAMHLGQTGSTATHLPRTMRFVNLLIAISDRVAGRLRDRAKALVSTLPSLPPQFARANAATFYQGLSATTALREINGACVFSEAQFAERLALEEGLAQADPATAHAKATADLQRVTDLSAGMATWAASFGDTLAQALSDARIEAAAARKAAIGYAGDFLAGIPLPGVGQETWRRLWAAALGYAQTAYPFHEHPNIEEGALCVLCQQPLGPNAKQRMADFAAYVGNELQTQATTAEKVLADLIATVPGTPAADYWPSIAASSGMTVEAATLLGQQVEQRLAKLRAGGDGAAPVDWVPFESAIARTKVALAAQRDAMAGLVDPEGRKQKEADLLELQAREWISKLRDAVLIEVERKKQIAALEAGDRLAQTHALTKFSNEIAKSELAGGFVERFNAELKALGGMYIPVSLKHKLEGKGVLTFTIGLDGTSAKVKSREVLSEGEQRVVALAAFLADVTGTDRSLPVIFDDPISSLDQRFEEAVAARLVELARSRQVVVFTHRLSMGALIEHAAEAQEGKVGVSVDVVAIDRKGKEAGVPATIRIFAQPPKSGFHDLDGKVRAAMELNDEDEQQERLKGACGNFRILVERAVEDHLCGKIVVRYRREIKTNGMLNRLTVISKPDCELIESMMTKYSAFEHAQAYETPLPDIDPQDLLADIARMSAWIKDIDGRAKVG